MPRLPPVARWNMTWWVLVWNNIIFLTVLGGGRTVLRQLGPVDEGTLVWFPIRLLPVKTINYYSILATGGWTVSNPAAGQRTTDRTV